MAVEINNNPSGQNDGGSGAVTAIVAILVIVVIGLAVYFGFFRGGAAPADNATDINVTVPAGSGIDDGPAGAGY